MSIRTIKPLALLVAMAFPASSCGNDLPVAGPGPPAPGAPSVGGDGAAGTITLTPETTFQTIDGFGTSLRLWDDPHLNGAPDGAATGGIVMTEAQRDAVRQLLYSPTTGIGLNRLRMGLIEPGWQPGEGGPIVPDGPYPGPRAPAMLDFMQKARAVNPALRTGLQVGRFDGWITSSTLPLVVARYIKSSLDYARSRGHEADWAGIHNEPSNGPPYFSGEQLRDITIELGNLLEADGYSTRISVPDDLNDGAGARKTAVILADPDARSSVKALSIHLYGSQTPDQMRALAEQYDLPLWMTEYSDQAGGDEVGWASSIVHEMLVTYNCAAVDMLFGFMGSRALGNPSAAYITLNSSGTAYNGYTLNPSYYQMGHWSRYVTRGSVRIGAASTNPAVKVSAFIVGGKKVIVLIHAGSAPASISIPAGIYKVVATQMSGTDRLSDKGPFKSAVILPPRSITTLVER